ncbi:hypothetical protein HF086_009784 [Spodoptera exigua]|uniref:Sorting nexin-13-like n=1 Tax=Spodoptera exigua TaxID=7107 RepID=A0A922SNN0_SPOEX|nr:hypothetical protein HF086_009784 [Spodoptera exigua]
MKNSNMVMSIFSWFGLVTVIITGLFGFGWYLTFLAFIVSFLAGVITVLYFTYDEKSIFSVDLDCLDDPLQQTNFSIQVPKVLELFKEETPLPKFDNRITGSETVDSFLNEIITIIINDYVCPWYEILTNDEELTNHSIKRLVLAAGANVANRVKCVDWIHLLSTRFPEELTTHLKLFKQSRVRLKHVDLMTAKDVSNDAQTFGKSKFYDSSENISGKTLKDIFFELECSIENRQLCRDIYCMDPEKEYELLCEVSEAVLYLVAPEEAWRCHALKLILIELLSAVVLRPMINLLSDPDNINRTILRSHSRDSAGEWELQDRQKLSSLQYLSRIIQARRATLGPQEGLSHTNTPDKVSEEVARSLKFLRASTAWRSNAQYLLEIELNEADAPHTSKAVLDNLRSSALELCDLYLAPNRPTVMGIPENCYGELVRKITTEGEEFTNNPVMCFDEVQKCVCDALEDDPSWQSDYMMDSEDSSDKSSDIKKDDKPEKKYSGDVLPVPGTRHNRSRSDIVGNMSQRMMINESAALVQDKGRAFGIYAIAVTRLSDNEVWHIYRRYSDFYDLHSSIKDKWPELSSLPFPGKKTFQNTSRTVLESRKRMLNTYLQTLASLARDAKYMTLLSPDYLGGFLSPENQTEKHSNTENDESVALKLFEEVLGIRGLWLRRRLLAPIRTLIADRVNKKVLEFVSSLTSPRNVVQYLKTFKDAATKARTRVAAKVALLSACSDDLRHIVGSDTARRGLLTVFDLFQNQEINRRLIFVLLEKLFKKMYSHSPRVPPPKKSVNV